MRRLKDCEWQRLDITANYPNGVIHERHKIRVPAGAIRLLVLIGRVHPTRDHPQLSPFA